MGLCVFLGGHCQGLDFRKGERWVFTTDGAGRDVVAGLLM